MTEFSEEPPVDPTIDPDLAPPAKPTARARKNKPAAVEAPPVEDRRIVGELIEEEEEVEEIVLTREERENFNRALTVGRRTATVSVADHDVSIRTLKGGEEMRIGVYTKPYLETQGFARAYQIGVCASSITKIVGPYGDEQPLWDSLKKVTSKQEIFDRNVEALEEFHPIMITKIYEEVMKLEREDADLGIKLGKY